MITFQYGYRAFPPRALSPLLDQHDWRRHAPLVHTLATSLDTPPYTHTPDTMKILSIAIARLTPEERAASADNEPVVLSQAFEVSEFGFFQRSGVREFLTFCTKTFTKRTKSGSRQVVEHEGYLCHVQMKANGLGMCVITDKEYPGRVAFSLINDTLMKFEEACGKLWASAQANAFDTFEPVVHAINHFQDPQEADKICKIQKQLDDTMNVMHQTIDKVLERGVKLDDLVERSKDLSGQSKMFYKTSKGMNSCCVIS